LAAVATPFFSSPSIPSGPPVAVLYIANPVVELGVLSPGAVREVLCPIVNKGDVRLVINEVDRGCGCGERVRRSILIPPGVTRELVVSIDTRLETGAIEKLTSFTTNDPVQPRFDLLVKASVHPARHLESSDADQRQAFSVLIPRQQKTGE
jgi:hypothetical protein